MKWIHLLVLVTALASPAPARAATTFQIVGEGFPSDVSADGSVIVGTLNGSYEVFRWTEGSGAVPLGMCSGCVLGRVGGFPSVSADGTTVSGTIVTADSLYMTMGIWHANTGWTELVPPIPADGGLLDDSYGSAWAVSGDGQTVGGYYWRPGQPGGLAHAFRWTSSEGLVDLGSSGRSSRISAASHDGAVLAGWDEDPVDSHWRATVWVNGVRSTLSFSPGFTEAHAVAPDGLTVAGMDFDDVKHRGVAMLWNWSGSAWEPQLLGVLPGTFAYYGEAHALAMSANRRTVVGYNRFDNVSATGFLWTPGDGMVPAEQFLAQQGITIPPDFVLNTLSGISDDGRTIVGAGQMIFFPWTQKWFVIRLDQALAVDAAGPAPLALRAFPNPARGATSVSFTLPERDDAELSVFDVGGRCVRRLLAGELPAGEQHARWDGRDERGVPAPAGVYLVRLRSGAQVRSGRLVLMK